MPDKLAAFINELSNITKNLSNAQAIIIGAIITACIAPFINHCLTQRREKKAKKEDQKKSALNRKEECMKLINSINGLERNYQEEISFFIAPKDQEKAIQLSAELKKKLNVLIDEFRKVTKNKDSLDNLNKLENLLNKINGSYTDSDSEPFIVGNESRTKILDLLNQLKVE